MPEEPPTDPAPDRGAADGAAPGGAAPDRKSDAPSAPAVLTALICEQCGNVNLIRVKGCWYCEKCHYKFDCYGW